MTFTPESTHTDGSDSFTLMFSGRSVVIAMLAARCAGLLAVLAVAPAVALLLFCVDEDGAGEVGCSSLRPAVGMGLGDAGGLLLLPLS